MEKRVLIIGGSGLVGQRLKWWLESRSYQVYILSRKSSNIENKILHWNPVKGEIDEQALDFPIVINLAGANIAEKRWSDHRKQILRDSRIKSTQFLVDRFSKNEKFPDIYIGASAIGIYGDRGNEWLDESSSKGGGFLADLTKAWEIAHNSFLKEVDRSFIIRIGIVLSSLGGAMQKTITPAKFGLASYFGTGNQYFSWIHIDDLCHIFISCIENKNFSPGVYNGVAPNPVSNKTFTKKLKQVVNRFAILAPAPAMSLKLMLGEMASIVLDSIRVKPTALEKIGYSFQFPELAAALKHILQKKI